MKFRVFIGIICLAFIVTVLAYGSNLFGSPTVAGPELVESTPDLVVDPSEISGGVSCEGETVSFAKGPLSIGFVGRPATLLPFNPSSLGERSQIETELSQLIFRGLVRYSADGEPLPDLASWQVSDDGLSITFTLDQGARWHDDTPVTSDDIVFTVSTLASGDFSSPGNFPWETVSATVIDQSTVELTLPVAFSPFLEAATVGLLPAHLELDRQNLLGSSFAERPIGNGSFKVANRWESDGFVLLEPTSPTRLENIEVRFYPSIDAMTTEFAAGTLALAFLPTYTSIAALGGLAADQYDLYSSPTHQTTQIFFRMDQASGEDEAQSPIADPAVRQALRLGTDRRTLIDAVVNGQGVPAEGLWPLESRFHNLTLFPMVQLDLNQAADLLEESGWLLPEADGLNIPIRQKDGVNLELDLLVSNQGVNPAIGNQLAQQWSQLGVRANVKALPPADYQNAITGRQFDVTVQKVKLSQDPDLYDFWSQEAIVRGKNISRWNHRPASEALEAGRQVWNDDERRTYYNAFRSFFERELPAFALYQDTRTVAISSNVQGQKKGYPGDLNEFFKAFPQWYILDNELDENCDATS